MHSPLLLVHLITVLLMVAFCGASPVRSLPSVKGPRLPQGNHIALLEHAINQRSMVNLGQGWRLWYDTFSLILPDLQAAETLESLFQRVADQALGIWSSREPEHYLHITKDYLVLEFFSQEPIPWLHIASIATRLLWASQHGFTGLFHMAFVHAAMGVEIYVHLQAEPLVAAAA